MRMRKTKTEMEIILLKPDVLALLMMMCALPCRVSCACNERYVDSLLSYAVPEMVTL